MRALFAGAPAIGHVKPLIPLIEAFLEAGHETAMAVSDVIPQSVVPSSIRRLPKAPNGFPGPPPPPGPQRRRWWHEHNVKMAWESHRSCVDHIREFAPDVLIRDFAERGAYLAAEAAYIPHITVMTDSETALRSQIASEGALLADCRIELGLPPDREGHTQVPLLGISLMHPAFYGPDALFVNTTQFFRPPAADIGTTAGVLPRPLSRGAARILSTIGTTASVPHVEFQRRLLTGLRGAGVEVVAAVPDSSADSLAKEFPETTVVGFVSLEPYLNWADIVVCHGGFATVTSALGRGIPLHITPFHSDQFFNAERVAAKGLGAYLPWEQCTPQALARSVLRTAHQDSAHSRAREFSGLLRELPGLEHCVKSVQTKLENRRH